MKLKEKALVGGCAGEENGWNTQLLYFTGSPLSRDDKLLFMISDKGGSPNIVVRDLEKGTEKTLTQNSNGTRPAGRLQRLRTLHDGPRHEPRVRRLLQVPRGREGRAREQHGQRTRSAQEGRRIHQQGGSRLGQRRSQVDSALQAFERLARAGRAPASHLLPRRETHLLQQQKRALREGLLRRCGDSPSRFDLRKESCIEDCVHERHPRRAIDAEGRAFGG